MLCAGHIFLTDLLFNVFQRFEAITGCGTEAPIFAYFCGIHPFKVKAG